jgi:hypothetical protein
MLTAKQITEKVELLFPHMFTNQQGWGIACSPKEVQRVKNGGYFIKNGRPVKFGLIPGSGDTIGWQSIEVTQEMVGQKIAVFCSIEIKTCNDRLSKAQRNWNRIVRLSGGIAKVFHAKKDDTIEVLEGEKIE